MSASQTNENILTQFQQTFVGAAISRPHSMGLLSNGRLIAAPTLDYVLPTKGGQGRLRAPPVADTASNKEWQRSKFETAVSAARKFRAPQQKSSCPTNVCWNCVNMFSFVCEADTSVIHYSLFTIHCSPFTIHHSLFTEQSSPLSAFVKICRAKPAAAKNFGGNK